ncbi:MAG: integrase family protein [Hyphomicrobiales bacterium]|nr:integrase family protein [Hyphomicrobiales bacterium]
MSKGLGKHPDKALSAIKVRQLTKPGRYADGNGLYLVVDPSGAKRWLLRTVVGGKRRDIGLGGLSLVGLAEAREKALTYRKSAREGGDPLAERRKARAPVITFSAAAEQVHADHKASWKNGKHIAQWINTIRTYANPILGELPISQITTPDVLRVLSPIWLTKAETARRVRQRIGTVLDWANAAGLRTGENPVDGVAKGLPKQPDRGLHHAAMQYADVPAFVSRLRASDAGEITRLAFEFLILTAARTGEVVSAMWDEIDEFDQTWNVPPERMKAGKLHRVPLPPRCIEILALAKDLDLSSPFIFPGRSAAKPISNMAFLMLLRRMNVTVTAHGFRSSFRDWASEATHIPREIAEMALAHAIESKVEAAYRRGDLLEKRRDLMEQWSRYLGYGDEPKSA